MTVRRGLVAGFVMVLKRAHALVLKDDLISVGVRGDGS
jgi:hypothetical protein